MKLLFKYLLPIFIVVNFASYAQDEQATANEKQQLIKFSEAFGHFIGRNLKSPGIDFDLDSLIKGIRNGAKGLDAPMPDEEYEKMMFEYQAHSYKATAEKNLKDAEDFLIKNKDAAGVVELDSGKLHYKIQQQGAGDAVQEGFSPLINFEGRYIDGSVFGSSLDAGEAVPIDLEQTIPGFKKGIIGMKKGEKRTLFIHPEIGFDTSGNIPPNSLLIFDIEVVDINTKTEAGSAE